MSMMGALPLLPPFLLEPCLARNSPLACAVYEAYWKQTPVAVKVLLTAGESLCPSPRAARDPRTR